MIVIDEWFELTPADESAGYSVLVNLANATSIWPHNGGSRIWFFVGHKDGQIDVKEAPEEIMTRRKKHASQPS